MSDVAIKVSHVKKRFRIPHERYTSLKQNAVHLFSRGGHSTFEAVKDADFEVKKGEFFGIVGRNGSGKSTLLKMLAGIYVPDAGSISVDGNISPFIELGVGFNPELSARDNVFLNGAILGLTRKQIRERFDEIIGFAELEDFVDQKLKNFSSGMQVRLAFSIAIQAQSEILLIDEVLAVGDSAFQKKCYDVFRRLKKEGRTIVFVTHDMANVQEFCDRVLVMNKGDQLAIATPSEANVLYGQLNMDPSVASKDMNRTRWGSGEIRISDVQFLNKKGESPASFMTGEAMTVRVLLKTTLRKIQPIVVGMAFFNQEDINISGPNSKKANLTSETSYVDFVIPKLPFNQGDYRLTVAVYDGDGEKPYDYMEKQYGFAVVSDYPRYGKIDVFGSWKDASNGN